jgi:sugar diacid utilization regulator
MDNSGQHGFAIIETRQGRISTELIMEQRRFLTELTAEIKSREFTILNWLGCKVRGLPDGVKEISKLLSVWQSNTQDANVVAECYQSVLKELQSCLDKKSADRQPGTYDFYFEWLDRSLSLKQVGLQKYIKY